MSLDVLTVNDCARLGRVSARTIRREILAGKLKAKRLRGRVIILPAAWEEYLQQCPSVAMERDTKPAFSMPADDLAALLGLTGTRRNGRREHVGGSKIVALAEARATRSRKPSTAG